MLELTLNADREEGTLQKEIAENQEVSVKYLDHIIADLKAAGLVVNVGGKKSGYRSEKSVNISKKKEIKLKVTIHLRTDYNQ